MKAPHGHPEHGVDPSCGTCASRASELASHHQDLADAFGRLADEEGEETPEHEAKEAPTEEALENDSELFGDEEVSKAAGDGTGPLEGGSLRNAKGEKPLSEEEESPFAKMRKKRYA